ncbi:unnamed protein product [Caenorhabditis brenneri]
MRIYYSDKSILNQFKYDGYAPLNSSISTSSFGLATPDTDCEVIDTLCPQLTQVFHVTVNGSPRLVGWNELKDNDTMDIVEEAGYVASWPGYCGTSNGALVELFSPLMNAYRYATSNEDILIARWNADRQFWRPTKVIGYLFNASEPVRTVHYPFNSIRPLENVAFNKILLRLRPIIRVKSASGLVAFTTKFGENNRLRDYKFDKVLNISLIDETTNLTMVQRAGYVFREESSARRCLGDIQPIYEYQNPSKLSEVHYVSSAEEINEYSVIKKWTKSGQMGFTSWGNFAFAKR